VTNPANGRSLTLFWYAAAAALLVVIAAAASIRLALIAAVIGVATRVAGYRYSTHAAIVLSAVVAVLALAGVTHHSAAPPPRPVAIHHPALSPRVLGVTSPSRLTSRSSTGPRCTGRTHRRACDTSRAGAASATSSTSGRRRGG